MGPQMGTGAQLAIYGQVPRWLPAPAGDTIGACTASLLTEGPEMTLEATWPLVSGFSHQPGETSGKWEWPQTQC